MHALLRCHTHSRNKRHGLLAALFAMLLSACASTPERVPADVSTIDLSTSKSDTAQDVDESYGGSIQPTIHAQELDRARFYSSQAQRAEEPSTRIDAILSAAEYYIQAQDFSSAEEQLTLISGQPLIQTQSDRATVIRAYIAYDRNQLRDTLALLRPLWQRRSELPDTSQANDKISSAQLPRFAALSTQQVDALLLGSLAYQKAGDFDSAVAALIQRERGLVGASRAETTRYIWQVINRLDQDQRHAIINTSTDPLVRNRIEQSLGSQTGEAELKVPEFNEWRDWQSDSLSNQNQEISATWSTDSPQQIAVLLPMTSRFKKAAQAIKEGMEYEHKQNQSSFQPNLQFYDIGDDPFSVAQYYNAAINNGADFVIGPLGRDYANQLAAYSELGRVATVLLGGDQALRSNVSRFIISPEQEGLQIAEQAWRNGHLSAAVIKTDSRTSRRTVEAFKKRWLDLGGKLAQEITYSDSQFDHSVELKQMFAINESQYRLSRLSSVLDFKPKFAAYQRADIDFIFMYANVEAARLLRPQINFFSGSKVPVYAPAKIYNGVSDPVNNMDLNRTRFPIMPWVYRSGQVSPYAGQLNNLFALGSDAYNLAAQYQQLRANDQLGFNGRTGRVSVTPSGMVSSKQLWALFKQGEAVVDERLIEGRELDIRPVGVPNSRRFINQGRNSENDYNQQTWDAEKAARRTPQRSSDSSEN